MKKTFLIALLTASAIAQAETPVLVPRDYVTDGATDLRPAAVTTIDGHMHLKFDAARVPRLPVLLAPDEDGLLRPVNSRISTSRPGSTEFLLDDPASTIVLKLGEREAIVQMNQAGASSNVWKPRYYATSGSS